MCDHFEREHQKDEQPVPIIDDPVSINQAITKNVEFSNEINKVQTTKEEPMTEKNYLDIAGMQARVDAKDQEQAKQTHDNLQAMTNREKEKRSEISDLFAKAVLSEREEAEKKRAAEIEKEKAQAVKEIEERYEGQGVKSEESKQRDAAWSRMLGNIPGMKD